MMRQGLLAGLVAAVAVLLLPGVAFAEAPSNDDFDNATAVTALPFTDTVDLTEATGASDDPGSCFHLERNTVWYSFTATEDVTVRLDFDDTYLETAVFTGVRGNLALVPGTCEAGWEPRDLDAHAGVTYHLKVAGPSWTGRVRFTADAVLPPANDDFAHPAVVDSLPLLGRVNLAAATFEKGEPNATCDHNYGSPSVWYRYTPTKAETIALDADSWGSHTAIAAVYTGTSMTDLTEVACTGYRTLFRAEADRTLIIQFNAPSAGAEEVTLGFREAKALEPGLGVGPQQPSMFDNVRFDDYSNDPEGWGTGIERLDFGDGTVVDPAEGYAYHRYAADGDYTASLTVSGFGGRVATTTKTVSIRTHDVGITGFSTPTSARVGATRSLEVAVANTRYEETVTVTVYRGTSAGYEAVGTLTKQVPVRLTRTTKFSFTYTFTAADLAEGNVVFKAVAEPVGVREALPTDNTVIVPATRVLPAA